MPAAQQDSGLLTACCYMCCRSHPQNQTLPLAWTNNLGLRSVFAVRGMSRLQVKGGCSSDEQDRSPQVALMLKGFAACPACRFMAGTAVTSRKATVVATAAPSWPQRHIPPP